MNLLQNLHRTPHILLCAFCAHRYPQQNESKPLHAGNPSLLHSHTLTFRSVFTNSGEQDAAFWDLQASPHGSQGWAGTHLLSLMVEHPSSTVMPAVDGSHMGLSMGQHCWTLGQRWFCFEKNLNVLGGSPNYFLSCGFLLWAAAAHVSVVSPGESAAPAPQPGNPHCIKATRAAPLSFASAIIDWFCISL